MLPSGEGAWGVLFHANGNFEQDMSTVSSQTPGPTRYVALDATRGIAACVVLMAHLMAFGQFSGELPSRVVRGVLHRLLDAAAAVDYFFVLSGFVLALPFLSGPERPLIPSEFILRRLLRIMPTYWGGLALVLLVRFLAAPYAQSSMPNFIDWSQSLSKNEILAHIMLIFGNFNAVTTDGPIWSLRVEMQTSLLLPLIIGALQLRPFSDSSISIFAIAVFMSFGFSADGSLPFLPLFVFGALLARYHHHLVRLIATRSLSVRLAILFIGCLLFWNRGLQTKWQFPDMRPEWMSALGSGIFIVYVLANLYPGWLLKGSISMFLGRISYSLYLIHLPVLYASIIILRYYKAPESLLISLAPVFAVLGGVILFYVVEAPSLGVVRYLKWRESRISVQVAD